jgi:sortase A
MSTVPDTDLGLDPYADVPAGGDATQEPYGGGDGLAYDLGTDRPATSVAGYYLDALRRRPVGRKILSVLTGLLLVGGLTLFTFPFFTDVYTDTVLQNRLEDQFETITVDSYDDWHAQVSGQQGAALTRIALPDIDVETLVVEGTSAAALRAGAGHYPNTPLPGQVGNVAIAGHRTTYGRPFNRIDELKVGQDIWLSTPIGDFRYVIIDPPTDGECVRREQDARAGFAACITHPRDWSVVNQSSRSILTLTSCHPKGSAAERIIVRAELAEQHPRGTYEQLRDSGQLQAAGAR